MKQKKNHTAAAEIIDAVEKNGGEIAMDQLKEEFINNYNKQPNIIISERYQEVLLSLNINEIGTLFNSLCRIIYKGEDIEPTEERKCIMPILMLMLADIDNNFEKYKKKAANGYASAVKRKLKELKGY